MGRFRITAAGFALVLVAAFAVAEAWRPPVPAPDRGRGAGTGTGTEVLDVTLASSLEPFDDCDAFLDTVRGEALAQVSAYGLGGGEQFMGGGAVAMREEAAMDTAAGAPAAMGGEAGGGSTAGSEPMPMPQEMTQDDAGVVEVSGTNVQEGGVDEPDVVKTDGRVLAAIARGRLQLVDLAGGARVAATVPLPDGWDHQLLLHGDRLLVTANVHEAMAPGEPVDQPADPAASRPAEDRFATSDMAIMPAGAPKVDLVLYDVSDPGAPEQLGSVRLDGQLASSRLVDGVVRLVLRSQPQPALTLPQPGPEADAAQMRALESQAEERNREIVRTSQAADWLPGYAVRDAGGDTVREAPLVDCADVRHPEQFRGFGMLSVLALPLDGDGAQALAPTGTASVLGDGDTVYATPDRLYVAMNRYEQAMTADIHEFDTSDPRRPVYTASGSVPGHLLNQWALSFHEGHLRVAATTGQSGPDSADSESAVHVLRRDGARLVEVGRAGGLGKGERIYAVRYFGDYGFVVTFRQTDPLYTLDLSDPAAPKVLGELKVPGFSSYLHPVGDGLLLGVGQDADESTGRRLGVQVSLFDVSDLAAPARVANLTLEPESSTDVEHDHRAFLWWPAARRAVMPYMHARWDESAQREAGFFGALALHVDGGLREAGRISHAEPDARDPWWSQVRRALVVGDTLWTMSERGLMASDVASLARRGFVEFDGPTPLDFTEDPGVIEPEPVDPPRREPAAERDPGPGLDVVKELAPRG
ncbi:MAG TPA: beta-propeller domain-containing protein [Egibacteraceae bacterium]|nr:beta-propeller domain-containing protein [Egibacteraceae bacterium]